MTFPKLRPEPGIFKYNEDEILQELAEYIQSTYQQHYTNKDGLQVLDLIFGSGMGKAYCAANCLKYYSRYGRKDGFNRKDLLKALHYGILLLYLDGLNDDE